MHVERTDWRRSCAILILSVVVPSAATAQYDGGTGEPDDPYLIYTTEHLNAIADDPNGWDKHFKLMADLDLHPNRQAGTYYREAVIPAFAGTFDGNGFVISHMTITGEYQLGLFGLLGEDGEVFDLGILDAEVVGDGGGGILVGGNRGLVKNCYSTGLVRGARGSAGGIAGVNTGTIIGSYSVATVDASNVGGLVGYNLGQMFCCYSAGIVTGRSAVGGLVGHNEGWIAHCYNTGTVSGGTNTGGLIGTNTSAVTCCYNTGRVTGTNTVGGLVGDNSGGSVASCFWDTSTSAQPTSAGGIGLPTDMMQESQTYLSAGWDWVGEIENGLWDVWTMPEDGGYPALAVLDGGVAPQLQGLGTADDPYLIADIRDLGTLVRSDPGARYRLTDSLDLSGIRWTTAVVPWFRGTFDGDGHTVSYLTIEGGGFLGLFGQLGPKAEVKDLGLTDVNIAGSGDHVGGLAGLSEGGPGDEVPGMATYGATISGCWSRGEVRGNSGVGGLVGTKQGGDVVASHTTGSISGNERVGGLVGEVGKYWTHTVTASSSTAVLTGNEDVGGLVGYNGWYANINTSFSTGAVQGDHRVGGLIGVNGGNVTNCYSLANVTGGDAVGGLIGKNGYVDDERFVPEIIHGTVSSSYWAGLMVRTQSSGRLIGVNETGSISSSFWDREVSGVAAREGGGGLNTAEMQTASTFLEAGWDFIDETENGTEDIWKIVEGQTYPLLSWQKYGGGTGEPNDPYLIYTVEHLNALGAEPNDYDKHFKLMADIDLSGHTYDAAVIAADTIPDNWGATRGGGRYLIFDGFPFIGAFDGNGHIISHLTITGSSWVGLFGVLGSGSAVTDLGLEAVDINGFGDAIGALVGGSNGSVIAVYSTGQVRGTGGRVGGLVGIVYTGWEGLLEAGTVTASRSIATVTGGEAVGGLIGSNNGPLTMSYSRGAVHGGNGVGGLVGENHHGRITMSYSTGPVGGHSEVGGLVGRNGYRCIINNSFATGAITGDGWIGGLVGYNDGGVVTMSYSTGTVTARIIRRGVGGLVGWNDDQGEITVSFWDVETSGQSTRVNGTGLTTAEMQTASTFLEAGWDFIDETENGIDDIWWIDEGQDYPRLWWELAADDVIR